MGQKRVQKCPDILYGWSLSKQYGEINGYLYEIMALFLEPATMASNLQLGPSGPMKAAVSLMETKIAKLLT